MAQTATKFKHGSMNFPILHENGLVCVYKNPPNEIFVEDLRTGAVMRISSYPHSGGGLQFTTSELVEPIRITNIIGWRVGPR